jgi:hypothetical protein
VAIQTSLTFNLSEKISNKSLRKTIVVKKSGILKNNGVVSTQYLGPDIQY